MRRDLLQRGYRLVRCLQVEGIPYLFAERVMRTVDGAVAAAPTGYTMSYALAVANAPSYSQDVDRKAGFAAASELTFTLGRQELVDEGLTGALFARPTMRATLTATVSDPTTTTFLVDSTSGFPASGSFYIGRERCSYSGTTGTSFTGVTRGVVGFPHYHSSDTVSGFRECTDIPIYWLGRFVTSWVHVVSPEGRYLADDWCTLGDYCWQEWRGYISEQPVPVAAGMELRCSSLVRLAAGKVGAPIKGKTAVDTAGDPIIRYAPTDAVIADEAGATPIFANPPAINVGTISAYVAAISTALNAAAPAGDVYAILRPGGSEFIRITEDLAGSPRGAVTYRTTAEWLEPVAGLLAVKQRFSNRGLDLLHWVVVEIEPNADFTESTIPATGLLAMEVDGEVELATYSAVETGWDGRYTAFLLSRRGIGGTRVNPWVEGAQIGIAVGLPDSVLPVTLFTLWQSSGQTGGPRGTYDALSFGFGLGIPDDYIDEDAFAGFTFTELDLVVADELDIAESVGGHLALRRRCVVQRLTDTGEIKLSLVSTDVIDDPEAPTLAAGDLLMEGITQVEQIESPNHIRVDTSYPGRDGPTFVVRDAARSAAQGKIDWDVSAPGLPAAQALEYGGTLLLLSDGQQAAKASLPPWTELEVGDLVDVTAAHPAIYSWVDAEWGAASTMARVVGLQRSMGDETVEATLLLAGQYAGGLYLCPSAEVTAAPSSSVLRVDKGSVSRFRAGDEVAVYLPGSEGTDYEEVGITSIDTSNVSYDVLNLDAALSVVTPAAGLVVTFPVYANANTRQRRYLYVRADKAWS